MAAMRPLLAAAVAAFALTACPAEKPKEAAPSPAAPAAPKRAARVTLLVTGHESGVLPLRAPRLLAQWKAEAQWPDALAFSTGDSFSGQAISSRFFGESTAEVMKALQYKAAALGNHDLDLGLETLRAFREQSGLVLLGANLKDKADSDQPLRLSPATVFTREGVKVGVLGLTGPKTVKSTVSGRSAGLELVPLDAAVGAGLQALAPEKPDVVLAVMDDCFIELQRVLAMHAEWKVDLVVGTRCEGEQQFLSGPTKYFSVGDDLASYVSAKFSLAADGTKTLEAALVPLQPSGPEDADLAALRERWQKKLDQELGQRIGFTKTGLEEDAPQLRAWVATALRDEAKADAALINKKGIRAALPRGEITRASVYSVIPFENAVVTVKVKGELLTKLKTHPEAFMVLPAKVEPERDYVLATTEYIYFGGDDLGLEVVAPELQLTGQVWQTPVIRWLEKQRSDEKRPLEKLVK